MICSLIGLMNSGKTLFMTYRLFIAYLQGKTIITNYNLNFRRFRGCGKILKINKDYLEQMGKEGTVLSNCAIGLDELYIWMDSRNSMGASRIMTYFFTQSSKDDTEIYFTAQHIGQADKRLRDNMHKIINCSRVLIDNGKIIPLNEEKRFLTPDQQKLLYIKGVEFKKFTVGFMGGVRLAGMHYIKASPVFKLYNTKEKINRDGDKVQNEQHDLFKYG